MHCGVFILLWVELYDSRVPFCLLWWAEGKNCIEASPNTLTVLFEVVCTEHLLKGTWSWPNAKFSASPVDTSRLQVGIQVDDVKNSIVSCAWLLPTILISIEAIKNF